MRRANARLALLSSAALLFVGCGGTVPTNPGDNYDNSKPGGVATGSKTAVSPGSLALTVSSELKANLTRKAGLKDAQAATLAGAGTTKVAGATLALALTDGTDAAAAFENSIAAFAPSMVAGSIAALADPSVGALDFAQAKKVLLVVVQSVLDSFSGRGDGLTIDAAATAIKGISKAAVSSLKTAGFDSGKTAPAVQVITNAAVSGLDATGLFSTENFGDLVAAAVGGAVEALKETAAADADTFGETFKELISGAVGALTRAGLTGPQSATVMGKLMQGAVGSMSAAGFSADDVVGMLDNGIEGAMDAFTGIGIADAVLVKAITEMASGTTAAFGKAGLPKEKFVNAVKIVVVTAISRLNETSVPADELAAAIAGIGKNAVLGLKTGGLTTSDQTIYVETLQEVIAGGLASLDDAGIADADAAGLYDDFINAVFSSLVDAGFTDAEIKTLSTDCLAGLQADLAEDGVQISDADIDKLVDGAADSAAAEE